MGEAHDGCTIGQPRQADAPQEPQRLSAEAGYVSNAWAGVLPGFLPADESPIPVPRLFPAYFWRLPGTGRMAIGAVLKARLSEIRNGAGQPR
jgi:hypothetical protein